MKIKYKELGEILYVIQQAEDADLERTEDFIEYLLDAENGFIEITKEEDEDGEDDE